MRWLDTIEGRPHRADTAGPAWVRTRLLMLAPWSIGLSLVHHPGWLAGAAALAGAALAITALVGADSRGMLLRRALTIAAFAALPWLTLGWSWQGGHLAIDPEGLALARLIGLRVLAIGFGAIALLAGLSGVDLGQALRGLGAPPRLTLLLRLTVRYVSLIGENHRRIDQAMRARGFRPRADVRTVTVLAQQVALVLAHALVRGRRLRLAMLARGAAANPRKR